MNQSRASSDTDIKDLLTNQQTFKHTLEELRRQKNELIDSYRKALEQKALKKIRDTLT